MKVKLQKWRSRRENSLKIFCSRESPFNFQSEEKLRRFLSSRSVETELPSAERRCANATVSHRWPLLATVSHVGCYVKLAPAGSQAHESLLPGNQRRVAQRLGGTLCSPVWSVWSFDAVPRSRVGRAEPGKALQVVLKRFNNHDSNEV